MIISTKADRERTCFSNIANGDAFESKGNYFMKIPVTATLFNAVLLNNGTLTQFGENELVHYVDGEFVVD